jgi:hypothetical protein
LLELLNKKRVLEEEIARLGRNAYSHLLSPNAKIQWVKGADKVLERLGIFGRDDQTQSPVPQSFGDPVHLRGVATTGIRARSFRSSANQPAADTSVASAKPLAAARRYSRLGLTTAYKEYIKACVADGRRPSREDDVAAMRAGLGASIMKKAVHDLRRDFAPSSGRSLVVRERRRKPNLRLL